MSKSVTCDFSRVSRRWGVRWAQIQNDVPILMKVIFSPAQDDLSDVEQQRVEVAKIEAHQKLNELIDESTSLMAQVLVTVPREWLVAEAPDEIDWSNPDSILDYVREDMSSELVLAVSVARNEAAKNSLTLMHSSANTQKRL